MKEIKMFRVGEQVPEGSEYLKTLFIKTTENFGYKMEVVHYFLVPLTKQLMEFTLLNVEINKHAQSWVTLLEIRFNVRTWRLFYIDWNYNLIVENVCLFGKWL